MPEFHRTMLHRPKGPGQRTGSHRLVFSVDPNRKDGYAFIGEFINSDVEVDLPVGTLIVRQSPNGSNTHPTTTWAYTFVPPQDKEWQWSEEVDRAFFLTFRDTIADLTRKNVSMNVSMEGPTPEPNGKTPPSQAPTSHPNNNGENNGDNNGNGDTPPTEGIHIRLTSTGEETWTSSCEQQVSTGNSVSYHSFRTSKLSPRFYCKQCQETVKRDRA